MGSFSHGLSFLSSVVLMMYTPKKEEILSKIVAYGKPVGGRKHEKATATSLPRGAAASPDSRPHIASSHFIACVCV